jgi:hypothetical protein
MRVRRTGEAGGATTDVSRPRMGSRPVAERLVDTIKTVVEIEGSWSMRRYQ